MMGNCVVFLPCSGDDSLYDYTSGLVDGKSEFGDGPLFYLSKFGRNKAVAVGVNDTEGLEEEGRIRFVRKKWRLWLWRQGDPIRGRRL